MRVFWPILIAVVGISGVVAMQERKPLPPFRDRITFAFNEGKPTLPAPVLKAISFGYDHLLTNLIWLRFLQQTPVEKVPKGETSWIYYDLDAITTLDPGFWPAFEHGGVFLSVITEDKIGAEQLLLKGSKLHPDRWRIPAYLAYHYQHELDQPDKAYEQYHIAAKVPGSPEFLGVFAARYLARRESIQASIRFLEGLRDGTKDERMKKMFQNRIEIWTKKLQEEESK